MHDSEHHGSMHAAPEMAPVPGIQAQPMPKQPMPMVQNTPPIKPQMPGEQTQSEHAKAQPIQPMPGNPQDNPVRPATIAEGVPPEEGEAEVVVQGPDPAMGMEKAPMSQASQAENTAELEELKAEVKDTLEQFKDAQSSIDEAKLGLVEADTQLKGLLDENHRLKVRVQKMNDELVSLRVELEESAQVKQQVMDLVAYKDAMELARQQEEIQRAEEEASSRLMSWILV